VTDINDILDDLENLADDESDVSVRDVQNKIGHRGAGVFLLVPGLLGMSPLGGIPTVPTLMALVTAVAAIQIAIGKSNLWLPSVLADRAVDDDRLKRAVSKGRGPARWLDRHFGKRLESLTGEVMVRVAAAICIALAATCPPLEVVPFAALIPLAGIALFGLAITLRDGAAMLVALIYAAGALTAAWMLMP